MSEEVVLPVSSRATFGEGNLQPHGNKEQYANDLKLAERARCGDGYYFDLAYKRYKPIIFYIVRGFFRETGGDRDDLVQEANIGFLKALRDYNGTHSSLASFVRLCVTRQVVTAIKTSTRQKHMALNMAVSFDLSINGDDVTLEEVIADETVSTAQQVEDREYLSLILRVIESGLSTFEADVQKLFWSGHSYTEIADLLNADVKSVDNALQRIKRKLDVLTSAYNNGNNIWEHSDAAITERYKRERGVVMQRSPQVDALVQYLSSCGGRIEDPRSGLVTSILAEALGKSQMATSQTIKRARDKGLIVTEVRGKRTYSVSLVGFEQSSVDEAAEVQSDQVVDPGPQSVAGSGVDYGVLAASLLREATDAVNKMATLQQRLAELEGRLRSLEETNAYLEADKIESDARLEAANTQVEALQALLSKPSSQTKESQEGIDRALRLVS